MKILFKTEQVLRFSDKQKQDLSLVDLYYKKCYKMVNRLRHNDTRIQHGFYYSRGWQIIDYKPKQGSYLFLDVYEMILRI